MCIRCSIDMEDLPRSLPNHSELIREIRINCPYPHWKRLRDERREQTLAAGHEARKSLAHLRGQCFFTDRGNWCQPKSRQHNMNLSRLRFMKQYGS